MGALIYVIDSGDAARLGESGRQLKSLLEEEKLGDVPLLVFANKQDLLQAMPADQISEALKFAEITNRTWTIQACSAKNGDNLQEGMEWLVQQIEARRAECS